MSQGEPRHFWVKELARGGMGIVELVVRREGSFRRLCAVKRLHAQFRDDPDFREMFLDEARIAGMLRHPNVVSVFDVGEDGEGPFLMMDYVPGVPLSALLKHAAKAAEPIPVSVVLQIVQQTAEGLFAAHELRSPDGGKLELVHRDVSPQNILVGYDGIVRVTDFGIARALGRSTRTATGVLKGKLGYASPEQLMFKDVDQRSDLFSLGIVLFELLTGRRLYSNKDGKGPERLLREPPPDVGMERDVSPELVELAFQLLAKEPDSRPDSAREVVNRIQVALNEVLMLEEGEPIALVDYIAHVFHENRVESESHVAEALARLKRGQLPAWPRAPVMKSPKRRPGVLIAGAAGLAALALLAGFYIGQTNPDDAEPNTAPGASETVEANSAAPTATPEPELAVEDTPTDLVEAADPDVSDSVLAETDPEPLVAERIRPRNGRTMASMRGERARMESDMSERPVVTPETPAPNPVMRATQALEFVE